MKKLFINAGIMGRLAIFIAMLCYTIPSRSQVYVGGEITGNETYSPGNNPYIVTQDLIITEDVTLTLLPGVELLFENGTGLINNGILVARGTSGLKIKFLPKNLQPLPGQWTGITFNNSRTIIGSDSTYLSGSVLSEVEISGASYSVTLDHGSKILIENTTISHCPFGVNILESGNNIIRGCNLSYCDFAIFIARGYNNPDNKIYSNTISSSSDVGIFINSISAQSYRNSITGNLVTSCNIGVHVGNYGNNGPGYNIISGNRFSGNKDALKLFQMSNSISNNIFFRNRGGITCWQSDDNTITQNLFSRNIMNAITLAAGSSMNDITYNSMNYNSGGVWIKPDSLRNSLYNNFLYNTVYKNSDFSFQILPSPQGPVQFNNIGHNGDLNSFKNLSDSLVHAEYNYWETISATAIDSIILDSLDLPEYGKVLYTPILSGILTTAPVPPPNLVIKQHIGDDLVVSWDSESINDLKGYNIYYGANDGLLFEHTLFSGMDTSINLGNFSVFDTVAVTVTDLQADGLNDQTEGHESDFTYAITAPYAGPDTAICFNSSYTIGNATAYDYESLTWSTSGDGYFNDTHLLNTVYNPGPQDYYQGSVYLFLEAESIESYYKDATLITFHDAPEVFAGNDTVIIADSALWINNAVASGYNSLKWTTSGDGTFDSDTVSNPEYQPGPSDLMTGEVVLSVTAFSACGSASDQINLTIEKGYTIEGRVHAGKMLAPNSSIYIYQEKEDIVKPLRSGLVSTDGNFSLSAMLEGTYYLYAVPDAVLSPGYLPTYYYNDIHWENAFKLVIDANVYDVDIDLESIKAQLPPGEGSVLGYCTTAPGNSGNCGDVTVLLSDKQKKYILDWELVRFGGDFRFKNLPFGEYVLSGEIAGREVFTSDIIVVSPANPKAENIELICTPAGYKFSVPYYYNEPYNDPGYLKVYPNPVYDRLYISGLTDPGVYTYRLVNSQGFVEKYFHEPYQNGNKVINMSALPVGFYVIEVSKDGNCIHRQKLIKH